MKITKFSQRGRRQSQQHSSGEHLRSRTHDFGRRKRQLAREHGRYRPTHGCNDQRHGARRVDRRPAEVQRAAHQHGHSANPDQERKGQADGEPLRSQENDFRQRHEHRDRGHHDRGNAGRHALLGPEQQSIVEDEDQNSEQRTPTSIGARSVSARPARSSSHKERVPRPGIASPPEGTAELRARQCESRETWIPTQNR